MIRRLSAILILIGLTPPAGAEEIFVPGHAATIQAAIELATPGDEVVVTEGTWTESIDLLGKTIVLRSRDGANVTTLTAPPGARAISCHSGEGPGTIIEGFTITGGGVAITGSDPTVRDCDFIGIIRPGDGAAVHCDDGAPLFDGCRFISNAATGSGGAVFCRASSLELRGCRFTSNAADLDGGAICAVSGAAPLLLDCRFTGNLAGANGGALAARTGSTLTLVNGLLVSNVAEFNGGAVYDLGGSLAVITNCTIMDNAAGFDGGAIYNQGGASALVSNTISRGNAPNEISDTDRASIVRHCDLAGGWAGAGAGNFDLVPQFLDEAAGDYRLEPRSPCVDAGDGAAVALDLAELDLGGRPRVVDGDGDGVATVDVGAYEHQVLANDNCADAMNVNIGAIPATNVGATTDATPHDWCGLAIGSDAWFRFLAPCDATIVATVTADGFQPFIALYVNGCPAPGDPPVLCGSGPGVTATVNFTVTGGATYLYRVGGVSGAQGAFTLTLSGADCPPLPVNDTCGNATTVPLGNTAFTTLGATTTGPNELAWCGSPGPDRDIWYRWFSTCNAVLNVSLCESDYDSSVVIYGAACPDAPGTALACNDDFELCGDGARVSLIVQSGQLYRIRVGGFEDEAGLGVMNLACTPIPECLTDTDGDGTTDIDDIVNVVLDFGTDGAAHGGDVNGNGLVDIDDLVLVVIAFGPCFD